MIRGAGERDAARPRDGTPPAPRLRIGFVTQDDLEGDDGIGGGLYYHRLLREVLHERHALDVIRIRVPAGRTLIGKTREKIRLHAALQRVAGERDVWLRGFPELAFLGADQTRGRRIALIHHSDTRVLPNRMYNSAAEHLAARRLRGMDTIVTVSRYWQERVRRMGGRDVRVIYNALRSTDFVRPAPAELEAFRARHGLTERPIVYLGNCQAAKGAPLAWRALRDEGYHLVTSGRRRVALPCAHLDLPHAEYLKLLWASDAAVLLSQFAEGWCITAHEAMMCATPVIGSGAGGMGELLAGGGQLVCRDTERLPEMVRELLADGAGAERRGRAGRLFAEQFTVERFATAWNELVLEGRAGAG